MFTVNRFCKPTTLLVRTAFVGLALVGLTACATMQSSTVLERSDIANVSVQRQDLEWINDVSRRVLVDPKVHEFARQGIRPLVDSIWYAVIDEARNDPTGPRRDFAGFAASLDGLGHEDKSRRVHAWFLSAGWALWGQPSRKHPDMLLRLSGERIPGEQFDGALKQVFGELDPDVSSPWLVNVSSQPMMAWSSPGVPVLNVPQITNTALRMYGNSSQQHQQLQRVVAGLTMVEEAVQWRFNQLGRSFQPDLENAVNPQTGRFARRNYIQIVAMAVALNIDSTALDLYNLQMRQCHGKLDTDDCRHLIFLSEILRRNNIDYNTPATAPFSQRRSEALSSDIALVEAIRRRYTTVAQQILRQIY